MRTLGTVDFESTYARIADRTLALKRVRPDLPPVAVPKQYQPKTCRGCGRVFQPTTGSHLYGPGCASLGPRFQSIVMPGAKLTHNPASEN